MSRILLSWLIVGLVSMAAVPEATGAGMFADSSFDDAEWTTEIVAQSGPTPTANAFQEVSGGNPGEFRRLLHTFGGNGNVISGHLLETATHDPSLQGSFSAIDISFDLFLFQGGSSNAVGYGPLLHQNDSYYTASGVLALAAVWSPFALEGLGPDDFFRQTGTGPEKPDFSATGSLIRFGYYGSNGSSLSFGTATNSGIDNWAITLVDLVTTTTSTTTSTTTTTLPPGACPLTPEPSCTGADVAVLSVNEKNPGKEKVRILWKKLDGVTSQGGFGDPVASDTAATICFYDESEALVTDLRIDRGGEDCGAKPCWKRTGSKGYLYKDKDARADGIFKLVFVSGAAGKGKALGLVRNNAAKGQTSFPAGLAAMLTGSVTANVQLLTSTGLCLEAVLDDVKKDTGVFFSATK